MKFTITITNCLISSTFQKKIPYKKKVEIKLITELDYKKSLLYISTKKPTLVEEKYKNHMDRH